MSLLVTGSSGFLGCALIQALRKREMTVYSHRSWSSLSSGNDQQFFTSNDSVLKGIDVVVHTASVTKYRRIRPMDYAEINVFRTAQLARKCVENGVHQFIYLSSIGVHGCYIKNTKVNGFQPIQPYDAYTQSKVDAENLLKDIFSDSCVNLTIIRPPVIYGRGAKGSFRMLETLIHYQAPLLVSRSEPKRSFISIYNLVDLILFCINNESAYGSIIVPSDADSLSIGDFFRLIAESNNKTANLLHIPHWLFNLTSLVLPSFKKGFSSLFLPFEVDVRALRSTIGWSPPYTTKDSLYRTYRRVIDDDSSF